jgi:hypothetical protein
LNAVMEKVSSQQKHLSKTNGLCMASAIQSTIVFLVLCSGSAGFRA